MDLDEIKQLIALMDDASLSEIEIENSERRVRIKRELGPPVVSVSPGFPLKTEAVGASSEALTEKEGASQIHQITSPIVGTFYTAPSPNTNAYVALGDSVKKGQVICIVEAMKLMNEIESDLDGRVVKICIEDGAAVEYGEALYEIEPA